MREITVSSSTPMPNGYGFLPKGIAYKTLHCRKLTREARRTLYIVLDNKKKQKNKQIGIRVPTRILQRVHAQAKQTLSKRRDAVAKRDAASLGKADAEMRRQFAGMPGVERDRVLGHGFLKASGRVGRAGVMPLEERVRRAVVAHVRHTHTDYEGLLGKGVGRVEARQATGKAVGRVLERWGRGVGTV
ncbi:hypothetical protein J1614_000785 [Plenodomus biglobosus]|nr:hypothetical protein J1614_000785 [Plenodomus biglobosus]